MARLPGFGLDGLTPGQRYTAVISAGLAVAMITIGIPHGDPGLGEVAALPAPSAAVVGAGLTTGPPAAEASPVPPPLPAELAPAPLAEPPAPAAPAAPPPAAGPPAPAEPPPSEQAPPPEQPPPSQLPLPLPLPLP